MTRRRAFGLATLLLVASSGCVDQGTVPNTATGDRDDWATHVQPYVAIRCGTLDCHGDPGRPFRVYADEGLRALADRDAPLSDFELDENVAAALGVGATATIDEHPLLLEPLAREAGGWHHVGDDVWLTRDDPGYDCLRSWLEGNDPTASCAAAAAAVPRTPPPPTP